MKTFSDIVYDKMKSRYFILILLAVFVLGLSIKWSCKNASATEDSLYVLFPVEMRDRPSWQGGKIESLTPGDKVESLSRDGNWYKVKTESGIQGFVAIAWVTGNAETAKKQMLKGEENKTIDSEREEIKEQFKNKVAEKTENYQLQRVSLPINNPALENRYPGLFGYFGSIGTIILGCMLIFLAFCIVFMPIFIWQIKNQTIKMNKLLTQIFEVLELQNTEKR